MLRLKNINKFKNNHSMMKHQSKHSLMTPTFKGYETSHRRVRMSTSHQPRNNTKDAKDMVMKRGINIMKNIAHSSRQIISKIVVLLALQKKDCSGSASDESWTDEESRRLHLLRNMKQVKREVVSKCLQCLARKG